MGGGPRTPTLTALLCLGLCGGPWDQVRAEAFPRPSLRADPGTMVSKGSPVTLWCQASLRADAYGLYKERGSEPRLTRIPQASSNKTGFRIPSTTSHDAGLYECAYSLGRNLSERSEPLVLVVTGVDSAPSLAAQPSPVVASGGNVSLVCTSQSTSGPFHLLNEGGAQPPLRMEPERRSNDGRWQAVFPVGPVSASHGGTYRCYASHSSYPNMWSHPSDPLHIEVTGVYRSPSLRAQPGSLLLPGDSLTLQCRSEPGFDRFALTKDEGPTPPQHLEGQRSPDFPLGPVTRTHGGRYRCYSGHSISHAWSAPSAPLDVLIAGADSKPSLSAWPPPPVPRGANVTLLCRSETRADTFHLHREGSLDPPLELRLQDTAAPSEATFTISPVTSGHSGTYSCYSSHSASPFLLSQPSDPLELLVPVQGHQWSLKILIGASVTSVLLLALLLFLFFRCQRQSKVRTLDAAVKDPQAGEGVELDPRQNRPHDDREGVTYAQVNRSRSRLRQGMASSPSSSRLWDKKGRKEEGERQMDRQAAAPAAPQEVTYAQLNHFTLRRETSAPPSSLSEEPPAEPSVYAALAVHLPRKDRDPTL